MVPTDHISSRPGLARPSALHRIWNRINGRARSRKLRFVYSPLYLVDLGTTPIDVQRSERILAYLLASGLLDPKRLLRPEVASLSELRLAHSRQYLELLQRPDSLRDIVGYTVWPELHHQALLAQRAAVGGTILATRHVLQHGGIAVNLGGGFHHAGRGQGKGFCIFNDVAVAVRDARKNGFSGPILIVDLDLHDGNGSREIFARDQTVFTFSIHNETWDHEPAMASMSLELGPGVGDDRYLDILDRHLQTLVDDIRPELVFYLAGTDIAADDRLGNWNISPEGVLARDRRVLSCCSTARPVPSTVIVLAGGYGKNTWRYTARFLAWMLSGNDRVEPPSTLDMMHARYRELTTVLQTHRDEMARSRPFEWSLTEEDILGSVAGNVLPSLFLGHFSHHAVELILEWTGILDRLRQMGFTHPTVHLDLEDPEGQTVRVYTDSSRDELLIELRLRIDRRSIPGMALLGLEWLLLQNPRASFSDKFPPLPGQSHPGLGLVADIITLLILMCDRLQLDGIVFVPSQYHLALKGRRFLRFLEATDEGWFRALQSALAGCSLAEATHRVRHGEIVDRHTGEVVQWRPMKMIVPISEALHDLVEGPRYESMATETEDELEFELRR